MKIKNKKIGIGMPTFFIADIAANHDGNLQKAIELIYLAAENGADAAKFQHFKAETIVSQYGFSNIGQQVSHQSQWSKSVFDVYNEASLPMKWTQTLKETCQDAGIDYLTAPYDLSIIEELSKYVCAWKLGSGDITWHEMIRVLSLDDKPLLIATGASNMDEVELAMDLILKSLEAQVFPGQS